MKSLVETYQSQTKSHAKLESIADMKVCVWGGVDRVMSVCVGVEEWTV